MRFARPSRRVMNMPIFPCLTQRPTNNYNLDYKNLLLKVQITFTCLAVQSLFLGLPVDQTSRDFGKGNSNRVYTLEKHNDGLQLMVQVQETNETTSSHLLQSKMNLIYCSFT